MEILFVIVVLVIVAWFWRAKQYDKQTTLDFDAWYSKYEQSVSPLQESRMAVAFLSQSIHFAWSFGAINSKQRDAVTAALKQMNAAGTVSMWLGSSLPIVIRIVGAEEVSNAPARVIGMMMLLAWMSPDGEQEAALRAFIRSR